MLAEAFSRGSTTRRSGIAKGEGYDADEGSGVSGQWAVGKVMGYGGREVTWFGLSAVVANCASYFWPTWARRRIRHGVALASEFCRWGFCCGAVFR